MASDIGTMSQLTVWKAIEEMRELSAEGLSFSFSFMSYDRTKQTTHGIVEVRNARLRNKSKLVNFENSELIEPYIDLDTNELRRFSHPTLMTFNGRTVELL
ncbi:hypothetical protein [Mongoliitalea lutea]|uniref:Uncharacterized protein n=1 Tax=Mongoliitalea lutea TaxID=849756 RepID=A0A8J3G6B3_9BACT|nr:hypothetical protein [Mongoliitalea lutea]GHB44419.1 hypothetical protein GCM10008106_26860 [Mongoliitalea lutea]